MFKEYYTYTLNKKYKQEIFILFLRIIYFSTFYICQLFQAFFFWTMLLHFIQD